MDERRCRSLALELARFESISGGPGEAAFPAFLAGILRSSPAFAGRGDLVRLVEAPDDPLGRCLVFGLVRGSAGGGSGGGSGASRGTVILTGHYDVVGVEAYGSLAGAAFEPEALGPLLIASLRTSIAEAQARNLPPDPAEELALADLASGDFLAGRGLLDMKAGLAAAITVLEAFAAEADRRGNLLFMAVPDEEGGSQGMRSALRVLPGLLGDWGLEARLAINLDAAVDSGDGAPARALFLGSVGKSHPFVLFRGRPSHAGAPFDGVNPALLAAELVRLVEAAPERLGASPGSAAEPPPPPAVLYHRDLRASYEVTTPASVFSSINVLTHDSSPLEVLERLGDLAVEAMVSALDLLEGRAAAQARLAGHPVSARTGSPRLLRWSELAARARVRDAASFAAARAAASAGGGGGAIPALASFVDACVDLAGIEGPAAVVGFAPPLYPRAALAPEELPLGEALAAAARAYAAETGTGILVRPFFPGISDMSFLSPSDPLEARTEAAAESPLGLDPLSADFRLPTVNAGPWGRDYHQRLERLHAPWAFRLLPGLVQRLARVALDRVAREGDSHPAGRHAAAESGGAKAGGDGGGDRHP